jgi:hypothetical protein
MLADIPQGAGMIERIDGSILLLLLLHLLMNRYFERVFTFLFLLLTRLNWLS